MILNHPTKKFKLKDIFTFKHGKCSDSTELFPCLSSDLNAMPYIGAKKTDNGVMFFTTNNNKDLISAGNYICFICQGEGSNGYNNYFDTPTIQTTSNVLGYHPNLNMYNGLFLVTLLDLQKQLFCFGRGRSKNLGDTIIELPVTNTGEIDWIFMTTFMSNIIKRQSNNFTNLISSNFVDLIKQKVVKE